MQSFLTRASIKTLEIPHSCTQVMVNIHDILPCSAITVLIGVVLGRVLVLVVLDVVDVGASVVSTSGSGSVAFSAINSLIAR